MARDGALGDPSAEGQERSNRKFIYPMCLVKTQVRERNPK